MRVILLLFGLGVYLALSPLCATRLYNCIMFFPWKYPTGHYLVREASGVSPRDVWMPVADPREDIHGWYYQKPNAKVTVLIHHGQGGNLTFLRPFAEIFLNCGANVLIYDYEGFGRSDGEPSIEALHRDGLAAFDYLCNKEKIPREQIVNCGESLGTGVAAYVTEKRFGAGLILFSPYTSVFDCGQQRYPLLYAYPRFLFPNAELECRSCLKGIHPPTVIVHGTADFVIPVSHSDELFRIASQPTQYIRLPDKYHCPLDWDFHPALASFLNQVASKCESSSRSQ